MAASAVKAPKKVTRKSGDSQGLKPFAVRIFIESSNTASNIADTLDDLLGDDNGYRYASYGRYRIDVSDISPDDFETVYKEK